MSKLELTDEFKRILDLLENSSKNIFITGKAGTGKSSLLKYFTSKTHKKYVILAPTGVAALNVGGQTIHSFFRFPPEVIKPINIKPDYVRAELFKTLDMVIIDEVSMVRSDLMNGVDSALRKTLNEREKPFGGIQMVFIGDLYQLPPVLTAKDRNKILTNFTGQYFFDAPVFKDFEYDYMELTKIFRQSQNQTIFIEMLNRIRNNCAQYEDMVLLNSRHKDNVRIQDDAISLTTRRIIANNINKEKLQLFRGDLKIYLGTLKGTFQESTRLDEESNDYKLPAPYKLEIKTDAQIIMLKNDPSQRWVNGTIGKIHKANDDGIWVKINKSSYKVEKETWTEIDYVLDPETKEIEKTIVGEFIQYPISLAYAITIHKSQGKTFDRISIDIGTGAFASGQVYVALSRCKTIEGIVLLNAIIDKDIIVDQRVIEFCSTRIIPEQKLFPSNEPPAIIREKIEDAINNKKNIIIEYQNARGETTTRELSNISYSDSSFSNAQQNYQIKAFCHIHNEERNFRIDRIISIEIK